MSTIVKEIQIQDASGQYATAPIGANASNIFLSNNRTLDQVVENFNGATAEGAGTQGLVPPPLAGDQDKVLRGDGTWGTIPSAVESINGKTGAVTLTAEDVEAIPTTAVGVANGVAELDSTGKLVVSQIPGTVGQVYEAATKDDFPETGEHSTMYVALDTNKVYRWSGSVYVEISEGVVIGTTADSAARGDWGQVAYNHAQAKGKAYTTGLYKFATNAEGHITTAVEISADDLATYDIQEQIQYNSMPTPSADLVGTVIQYTGADGTYSSGTFYKCVINGTNYVWEPTVNGLKNVKDGTGRYAVIEGAVEDGSMETPGGTEPFTKNVASGTFSHAEGVMTTASGWFSHAEGSNTSASGNFSHTEGASTIASGNFSHAEGSDTLAIGNYSHAEGGYTTASGVISHAEGNYTSASGDYSHAEGISTSAGGENSHAEGGGTIASGKNSHAQNNKTIAQGWNQTVIGRYNTPQGTPTSSAQTDYAFIIGNGTNASTSNALAVQWDGLMTQDNGATAFKFTKNSDGKKGYIDETGAFNEFGSGGGGSYTVLTETLAADATSVTFTNDTIGTDVLIDVYAEIPGFNYLTMEKVSDTSVKITYPEHTSAVKIYLALISV